MGLKGVVIACLVLPGTCSTGTFVSGPISGTISSCRITNCVSGSNTFASIDGVQVLGYGNNTTLQATINNAGTNGTVYVPAGTSITLTSAVTISQPGLTLRCEPGSSILKGASLTAITVAANNVTIDSCTINGEQASGYTGNGISVINVNGFSLYRSTVENNAIYGVYLDRATNFTISQGNKISGNLATQIFGEATTAAAIGPGTVDGNVIDASATSAADAHAFTIHTTASGSSATGIRLTNNTLRAGTGFCAEEFQGSGLSPTDFTYSHNTCTVTQNNGDGGFSLSGAAFSQVENNTCNGGGFTVIACIELAQGSVNNAVSGNVIQNVANGISVSLSSFNSIGNNAISGTTSFGITVTSSVAQNAHYNTVVANNIQLTRGLGIWVQCNNASADCSGNAVVSNTITGPGTSVGTGLQMERDSGALDSSLVAYNLFANLDIAVNWDQDTNERFFLNVIGANVATHYAGTAGAGLLRWQADLPAQLNWAQGQIIATGGGNNLNYTVSNGSSHVFRGGPVNVPSEIIGYGSTINAINYYSTASITPTAVAAQTCSDQTFTITGLVTGDKIGQIIPPAALGNVSVLGYVSASNSLLLHFCNPSNSSVMPPAGVYSVLDMR